MKRILLFVFLSGCISLWASPRLQKKIHLPETIYAVPGIECNIYFENIFLTINASNFAFEVKCKKGSCEKKRWRFTPGKTDTGTYDLQLNVYDDQGLAATASTKLKIVPADAGKGKNISLLLIGSSELERYHAFPIHIYRLFQQDGNPTLKMLGENGPGWPDQIKEVRHEGYGGWSYRNFTTYGRSFVKGRSNQRGNPFWDPRKKALDFKTYFKKHNGNKAPDFVLISLGGNDIFLSTDKTLAGDLAAIRKRITLFLSALRKAAPDTKIALAELEYCSHSQDAFGRNYFCLQNRWQMRKNYFHYRAMLRDIVRSSGDPKLFSIPYNIAIDNENNVVKVKDYANSRNHTLVIREGNALHPLDSGYQQCADYFYAWMKYQLTRP